MRDTAEVWVRDGKILVAATVNDGGRVTERLVGVLDACAPANKIGELTLSALATALEPSVSCDGREPKSELVAALGLRTYAALTKGARHVLVSREDSTERVEVIPMDGTVYGHGAFAGTGEVIDSISGAPADIGDAVVLGISLSFPRRRK